MSLSVAIQKRYADFALDVRFSTQGDVLAILGASGSGKSMTLQCIAGIETPDKGQIAVNGRTLYDSEKRVSLQPQKRNVGYLFQSYALFPHMTVAQNIACAARGAEKARVVAELARRFALEGLEDRLPAQLSGGQQQRVALARIWAYAPDVLLLDEPFSALDAHLKEALHIELLDLLRDYAGDVVLVTHSRDEAYTLCGHMLILDAGRVCALGETKALFRNPGTVAAARLTGCKNISRARPLSASRLYAEDWGCALHAALPVSPKLTHVGVRAHDFQPCADAGGGNAIPVQALERVENPFEWSLLFRNAAGGEAALWWKRAKDGSVPEFPPYLRVPPECVLPLEST